MDNNERVFVKPRGTTRGGALTAGLLVAMDNAGSTYRAIAEAAGVNHQTVWNLAHMRGGVDLVKAVAIADAVGRHPNELFSHKNGDDLGVL